ncbi:MAG: heat-inducible transcriptional repressor HrcA [Chloroflexota bacterium]|nr:heat-inducible transcriptional repressor HrcA [Chloroflexota bacterium]
MSKQLSERSRQVLKLVIEEYVATAHAVGSELLRDKYRLPYSSATLRNEMAALEREGYLTHLHTSGGRMPSEAGYRLFVENLMDNLGLSPTDMRRVEHQFHQVEGNPDLERWAELAASVLAQLAHNAALVTTPHGAQVSLRQIHLISVQERSALAVAVMDDGGIRQAMCALPYAASQEELNSVSTALNAAFAGLPATALPERLPMLRGTAAAEVAPQVLGLLGKSGVHGTISQSGIINMLSQPEFSGKEQARRVVEIIEGGSLVTQFAQRVAPRSGVHVIIGSETGMEEMSSCSLVSASYSTSGSGYGLLMVVGPTRMNYERTISSVYYVSRLLSHMLNASDEPATASRRAYDTTDTE